MTTVPLGAFDLALAALLVVLNAGLSLRLGLALERPLLVAAVRTAVQLFLVGFVIKALFALASPLLTGLMVLVPEFFRWRGPADRCPTRYRR